MQNTKVGMISLGCDKNRVDSEKMLALIKAAGFTLVDDAESADVIVVNTCAFIDAAKKEAIETVFECAALKGKNLKKLIVTGCFAERYGDAEFPEVDMFLPLARESEIADVITDLAGKPNGNCLDNYLDRVQTTPPHYAYLKIADGCDNRCAYCAIPHIRGRFRSRTIESLVAEAERLSAEGVKELILVAQDTTAYGKDLYGKPSLPKLLRALSTLPFWKIRILYAYPELIDDELLTVIRDTPNIAEYLDIPLQHADNALLKKMNRRGRDYPALIEKIRAAVPGITLRSSFICGFPGETETEHKTLLDFLATGVDYGGFFAYSPEEGTPSYNWKPRADKRTVKRWVAECEDAQTKRTVAAGESFIGKTLEVIYEGIDFDRQMFYGRSEHSAPEVDPLVYFTADFPLTVGAVYAVTIEKAHFHLYGTVSDKEEK